jgi:hypothetical protein
MTITEYKDIPLFQSYYRPDRFKAYKALPNLKCMFCGKCSPIPFDMDLHLYEEHRKHLGRHIPVDLNAISMDEKINYLLEAMEWEAIVNGRYFGCEDEST